jgi:hypothetical protein
MLLGNGVIPVVVFDGCRLPMKADEEESRRRCVDECNSSRSRSQVSALHALPQTFSEE